MAGRQKVWGWVVSLAWLRGVELGSCRLWFRVCAHKDSGWEGKVSEMVDVTASD